MQTINVRLTRDENADYYGVATGQTVAISLDEYIAGVVAAEVGNTHIEAAKAQAIAARTYAHPYYNGGKTVTDTSTNQAFRISRVTNGKYPNAVQAAKETSGEVLTYQGKVLSTCSYSASNGGRTVSSEKRWGGARAWLIEQDDPWDYAASGGKKNGHGVGMSQVGAAYAAKIGKTHEEILAFYYPGTAITQTEKPAEEQKVVSGLIDWKTFIDKCKVPLDEKWGYIWGESGAVWTEEKQRRATRDMTKKYGSKWIGRRVTDCSGLPYWAMKQLGGKLYHGANTIYNSWCTAKGKLADKTELRPGSVVFLYNPNQAKPRHHIGVFIGNDTVVEAQGTQAGVVTSRVSHWDEWGELKGIDYTGSIPETLVKSTPTLKNGSRGESVKTLQTLLGEFGYALAIDGIFGSGTESAVVNFQQTHGLTADGVCGAATWAALKVGETMPTEQQESDEDSDKPADENEELLYMIETLYAQLGECIAELKMKWG